MFIFRWTSPGLDKSQIRLVLFRDHDIKGRKLLFDSAAVQLEPQKVCKVPHYIERFTSFETSTRRLNFVTVLFNKINLRCISNESYLKGS